MGQKDRRWIAEVAEQQHGVITRRQLLEIGVSDRQVDGMLHRFELVRVAPAVFRVTGSPGSFRQELLAAVLDSNGFGSHRAAAAVWDLEAFRHIRKPEVVSERWRRRRAHLGLGVVHETKDLRAIDSTVVDGIPVTTVVRTLIDLGAVASRHRVGQALDDACRRKLVTIEEVRARFVELARRGRNGIGTMRALLAERPGGEIPPDSYLERLVIRALADHGVPAPVRQHRVATRDFVAYLDLAWPEHLLALECDGTAFHMSVEQFHRDRERQNRLVLLGWTVLRYTYRDASQRPAWLAEQVLRALASPVRRTSPT
ncbi:MAG: hypothetical protein MUE34_01065 [Acidimicrobiales bacterium]|jgi:predicted transcriptional regulator of viral defense system|nr:hypothetical protein [Acidimicrobiales bacterium]